MEVLANGGCYISSIDEAHETAARWMLSNGFRPIKDVRDYIEASRGNQLAFRTKGAMFSKPADYPIRLCLKLNDAQDANGPFAQITVYEDFGFGVLIGVMNKFKRVATEAGDSLIAALSVKH